MNETTTFEVSGMSCGHCVAAVRNALNGVEGVSIHDVDIGSVTIRYGGDAEARERAKQAIREAGYQVEE